MKSRWVTLVLINNGRHPTSAASFGTFGMGWDGMRWDEMGRVWMERVGMEWDGVGVGHGWHEIGRVGMG